MTHRSSTNADRCGKRSETSMPDWPCLVNLRLEASRVPGLRTFSSGSLLRLGIGSPWRLVSSGLGSHRSTWLGPPYMNRQMHAVAVAGECGGVRRHGGELGG